MAAGCRGVSPARRPRRSGTTRSDRLGDDRRATLVLVGELDLLNPPRVAAELAERIPDAKLSVSSPASATCRTSRTRCDFRLEIERFLERGDA